jgi:hypothetical protein
MLAINAMYFEALFRYWVALLMTVRAMLQIPQRFATHAIQSPLCKEAVQLAKNLIMTCTYA